MTYLQIVLLSFLEILSVGVVVAIGYLLSNNENAQSTPFEIPKREKTFVKHKPKKLSYEKNHEKQI